MNVDLDYIIVIGESHYRTINIVGVIFIESDLLFVLKHESSWEK